MVYSSQQKDSYKLTILAAFFSHRYMQFNICTFLLTLQFVSEDGIMHGLVEISLIFPGRLVEKINGQTSASVLNV